ncbi:MAG: esterase [Pirellulaceae bacterium]|nr:esterase [Pirellulaceae bacterium]
MNQARGEWRQVTLAGHDCELFEPAERNPHGWVVLYLHGVHVGRLAEQAPTMMAQFERHGLPVVVPITGQSWWTDRISPDFDPRISAEQHLLENVLPLIADRWGSGPPRIGLLGTSMGGQGALRLAYRHPETFPVVAAIAPAIDFQLRHKEGDPVLQAMYADAESARQDTATLHVHPLNWPRHQFFCCDPRDGRWFDSADRLRMKLWSLGIPHECDLETSAGGHGFEYYNRMAPRAIGFLAERLERERRRLV